MTGDELVSAQVSALNDIFSKVLPKVLSPDEAVQAEKRHWRNCAAAAVLPELVRIGLDKEKSARAALMYADELVNLLYSGNSNDQN